MGSEVRADVLVNEEIPSNNPSSISKLPDETSRDSIESKNVMLLSESPEPADSQRSSIGPVTPDSNRENADQNHDLLSPLTVLPSPPRPPCPHSTLSNCLDESSYRNTMETPKEALFDAFAPGPSAKFMGAPSRQKYRKELMNHVVRRLDFNCAKNLAQDFGHLLPSDEERLFEIIYGTILDAIFSEQSEKLKLGNESLSEGSDLEQPRTPKSARFFSGIADTCPGAPLRSSSKSRNIDKEVCRKLEF